MCEQIDTYLRGRQIIMRSGRLDCESIQSSKRPDPTYCVDPPPSTTDGNTNGGGSGGGGGGDADASASAFAQCLSLVRHRMLQKETQITWMGIAAGVVGFLAAFFCILYLLHRRSLRKRQEMLDISKLTKIHSGEFGSNRSGGGGVGGAATEMLLLKKPSSDQQPTTVKDDKS